MLGECRTLVDSVVVHSNVSDRWQWDPNPYEGYTVIGAYQALTFWEYPLLKEEKISLGTNRFR